MLARGVVILLAVVKHPGHDPSEVEDVRSMPEAVFSKGSRPLDLGALIRVNTEGDFDKNYKVVSGFVSENL